MPPPTAGQHHRAGFDAVKVSTIQHLHAATSSIAHQQLGHPNAAPMQQARPLFDTIPQHIHQGPAGAVLYMQHPPVAVGCTSKTRPGGPWSMFCGIVWNNGRGYCIDAAFG